MISRSTALHLASILILGFLAYSNTFNSPFMFDDISNIPENPFIKDISYFTGSFTGSFTDKHAPEAIFLKNRAVGYFSFALNWWAHDTDVKGYHAVNLTIHIVNAMLVYWLMILTFRTPHMKGSRLGENSYFVALAAALLFVSHPIQTQAVTYIVQRFASLAALFYLSSLTLYIKFRLSDTLKPKSVSVYVLALLSAVLAMKTKEIAFTLPLVITLYEFVFFKGLIRKRLLYLLPFFLISMIIPISLITADMPQEGIAYDTGGALRLKTQMPRSDYLFTQFRVITTYIRLLVFPINQTLDYDYPEFRASLNPQVFLSILFLLSVLGLGLYLLHRSRTSEPNLRIISFGIFWFFIALSVESSVVPIVDVIFEHRAYLPSVGVFIAAATGVFWALDKLNNRKSRLTVLALLTSVVLALSAATYTRNAVWAREETLWKDVVKKSPNKARGYNNLGLFYKKQGLTGEAIENYEHAIMLEPDISYFHSNLGVAYIETGRYEKAIEHLTYAVKLMPGLADIYVNLGIAYKKTGRLDKAAGSYETALLLEPDNPDAHYNLANAYMKLGRVDDAIPHYEKAITLRPDDPDAHKNLAIAYKKKGLTEKADELIRIANTLKEKSGKE